MVTEYTSANLFFDVFIEDIIPNFYRGPKHSKGSSRERFEKENLIRSQDTVYKYQSKIDITRYVLASYSKINWKKVIIRIEIENPEHKFIFDEIKEMFPNAEISRHRSATSEEYFKALKQANFERNDWVFFSPNNDHPLMCTPNQFKNYVTEAELAAKTCPKGELVSCAFSHFSESNNMFGPLSPLWGYYGGIFAKKTNVFNSCKVIRSKKLLLDSLHMYKYSDLLRIFGGDTHKGKVIRPEDTDYYLKDEPHNIVIPNFEICRHFDSTAAPTNKVPLLFIPSGFFENNIQLFFGSKRRKSSEEIFINPLSDKFVFQDRNAPDMNINPDDIPFFWKDRISSVVFEEGYEDVRSEIAKENLYKPWGKRPLLNFLKSFVRLIKFFLKKIIYR